MTRYISNSGDLYEIPDEQYKEEKAEYEAAVELGDESTMLHYEEGMTGWRLLDG